MPKYACINKECTAGDSFEVQVKVHLYRKNFMDADGDTIDHKDMADGSDEFEDGPVVCSDCKKPASVFNYQPSSDSEMINLIRNLLSDGEWSSDTLETIAESLTNYGKPVKETDEVYKVCKTEGCTTEGFLTHCWNCGSIRQKDDS